MSGSSVQRADLRQPRHLLEDFFAARQFLALLDQRAGLLAPAGDLVLELQRQPVQLQLVACFRGEELQEFGLLRRQGARPVCHDAERAEAEARRHDERRPGVEADEGRPGDEGAMCEPLVLRRVLDVEDIVRLDRSIAEGDAPRRLDERHAALRPEPLPIRIDQRHRRDRHFEDAPDELYDPVKPRIRPGIQDLQILKGMQPLRLRCPCRHLFSSLRARIRGDELTQCYLGGGAELLCG